LKYQVQLDVYEGPLDLLLRRLNNEEIPAGEIPVCIIIDQFIDYYMGIAFSDLEEGSRFLVLAATLLAVKARLLLPRREEEDEESDTLLDQDDEEGLLETDFDEYLAFQDAAMTLEERAREWMMVYRRPPTKFKVPEQRGARDDISRLVEAFHGIIERISKLPEPYMVKSVPYDLDDVMNDVLVMIKSRPEGIYFCDFFPVDYGREDVIFTFLAVLELVYEGKVLVREAQETDELVLILKESV
jgi:segregation and condensation protein A